MKANINGKILKAMGIDPDCYKNFGAPSYEPILKDGLIQYSSVGGCRMNSYKMMGAGTQRNPMEYKISLIQFIDGILSMIPECRDGLDGRDGLNGSNGLDGRDGRNGKNGCDGLDGKDGVDGRDGLEISITKESISAAGGVVYGDKVYMHSCETPGNEAFQSGYISTFNNIDGGHNFFNQ